MTGANCLPAQPTTRGLRCQCVPTPAEAARLASKLPLLATTRLFEPIAGGKSARGASNSTGGGYYGARMARRRSRANSIWEMSAGRCFGSRRVFGKRDAPRQHGMMLTVHRERLRVMQASATCMPFAWHRDRQGAVAGWVIDSKARSRS